MALSQQQAEQINDAFCQQYWVSPYSIKSSGLSFVKMHESKPNAHDADDFCLVVTLRHALPAGVTLPSVYQGLKVFTEIRPGMPTPYQV
jgi:hypothetical protein